VFVEVTFIAFDPNKVLVYVVILPATNNQKYYARLLPFVRLS
jgi:hypothetical protein